MKKAGRAKKRPVKKKKAPAVELNLEEKLFFNKPGGSYETGGPLNDHQILQEGRVTQVEIDDEMSRMKNFLEEEELKAIQHEKD